MLGKTDTKEFLTWFETQNFKPADPALPPTLPGGETLPDLPDLDLPPVEGLKVPDELKSSTGDAAPAPGDMQLPDKSSTEKPADDKPASLDAPATPETPAAPAESPKTEVMPAEGPKADAPAETPAKPAEEPVKPAEEPAKPAAEPTAPAAPAEAPAAPAEAPAAPAEAPAAEPAAADGK